MASMLNLDCLVLGEPNGRVFNVKISNTESVATLKAMIKENQHPNFSNIPAIALDLWNVSIPYSGDVGELLRNLSVPPGQQPLLDWQELSAALKGQSSHKCLAILVRAPSGVCRLASFLPEYEYDIWIQGFLTRA